jgi:hypothetical protein
VLSVLLNPEQVTFNCYMDLEDKQNVGVSLEPIQLVSNWEG